MISLNYFFGRGEQSKKRIERASRLIDNYIIAKKITEKEGTRLYQNCVRLIKNNSRLDVKNVIESFIRNKKR